MRTVSYFSVGIPTYIYISPKSGEVIQLSSVLRRLNYVFFDRGNKIAARSVDNLRLFRKSG